MNLIKKRIMMKNRPVFVFGVIIPLLFSLLAACGEKAAQKPDSGPRETFPESFTFFNVTANTVLNEATVRELEKAFGSHVQSRRTPLDLEIHQRGMIAKAFSELNALNAKINGVSNERVEHDTVLLTFRYPPKANNFFKYIKVWFSNQNQKPLMVEILTEPGSRYLIDGIREKYGNPQTLQLPSDKESLEYWVQAKDTLIASRTRDRFGADIHHIKIYFVNNMETLSYTGPGKRNPSKKPEGASEKINPF
jgi:hypothetical protein